MTTTDFIAAHVNAAASFVTPKPALPATPAPPDDRRGDENPTRPAVPRRGDRITMSPEARAAAARQNTGTKKPPGLGPDGQPLTKSQEQQVDKLAARDREVRAHEQAHVAAGGSHVAGGPTYDYQEGPNGRRYAIGGEVSIDTSPAKGDPAATILKMETVRRAALAPGQPSAQDRAVATKADREAQKARVELQQQRQTERAEAAEADEVTDESADESVSNVEAAVAAPDAPATSDVTKDAAGTILDLIA